MMGGRDIRLSAETKLATISFFKCELVDTISLNLKYVNIPPTESEWALLIFGYLLKPRLPPSTF